MDGIDGFDDINNKGHLVKIDHDTFVERDVLNIVQKIQEYDPNLKVQYLGESATVGDAPFRILEWCKDHQWRICFYAWKLDQTVLDRIWLADTHFHRVLERLDASNAAVKRESLRRYREKIGEAKDITQHIVASPKGRYSVDLGNKVLKIDDDPQRKYQVVEKDT
jgi:hypothetical protein